VFSVPPPPRSTPFPYTTLFRSVQVLALTEPVDDVALRPLFEAAPVGERAGQRGDPGPRLLLAGDRVGEDVAPVLVASDVAVGLVFDSGEQAGHGLVASRRRVASCSGVRTANHRPPGRRM